MKKDVENTAKQIQEKVIQVEAESRKLVGDLPAPESPLIATEIPKVANPAPEKILADEKPVSTGSETAAESGATAQTKTTESVKADTEGRVV